jgi:integrase
MALTDTAVRNAKAGDKTVKLFDGGGLHLVVNPAGSKLWRLKYRVHGRERLLSIGAYPAVSLKAARQARDEAKGLIAAGQDPSTAKRQARADAAAESANTFSAVATELLDKLRKEKKAPATIAKAEWLLGMANASLGSRPIADITAREILAPLRKVEASGNYETARRLRSAIGRVFRLAIATDRAETDPTLALKGALIQPTPTPRPAITELARLRDLLRAVEVYDGQPTTRAALLLMALLAPRPGELRQARWEEFDVSARTWTIPADRMKMRREHRVPLPGRAVRVLEDLRPVTGSHALVLPSLRSPKRPLSENTMNAALRTMGYGREEMTSHGFRAAFSTIANEAGIWNPDAIERALAHVEENKVRRAYARGEHWDERVRLMDWWADCLFAGGDPA